MTVVRDSRGVMRAASGGVAGWALIPSQEPDGGWPLLPAEPVDDLVAIAAALNAPGDVVYVDRRADLAQAARS